VRLRWDLPPVLEEMQQSLSEIEHHEIDDQGVHSTQAGVSPPCLWFPPSAGISHYWPVERPAAQLLKGDWHDWSV